MYLVLCFVEVAGGFGFGGRGWGPGPALFYFIKYLTNGNGRQEAEVALAGLYKPLFGGSQGLERKCPRAGSQLASSCSREC